MREVVKLVDIFAGPGGLSEGFSNFRDPKGGVHFRVALSIEKDDFAFETLRLRAFSRLFHGRYPNIYHAVIKGKADWTDLSAAFPSEARAAEQEAVHLELGPNSVGQVRNHIRSAIGKGDHWVLLGGPPCQAYSLAGRSRNRGISDYCPEHDKRTTLYLEYLQILADHAPPIFVMENVKGLLSATLNSESVFERIRDDLIEPSRALTRVGRQSQRKGVKYELRPFTCPELLFSDRPSQFVLRSERFGIPQARHRVIILGVRCDLANKSPAYLQESSSVSTTNALSGLPRVRSGISGSSDSADTWKSTIQSFGTKRWLDEIDIDMRTSVLDYLKRISVPRADRGREVAESFDGSPLYNHTSRSHMRSDLERYFYASAFAATFGFSPALSDFPKSLLPEHKNIPEAINGGLFSDRFRVQLKHSPSTTITSHIAKDGHYYIHYDPTQCRSLTVREAARLQTFPDDYFFAGPRTEQYAQVGNAVPPRLAEQIASVVANLF